MQDWSPLFIIALAGGAALLLLFVVALSARQEHDEPTRGPWRRA